LLNLVISGDALMATAKGTERFAKWQMNINTK